MPTDLETIQSYDDNAESWATRQRSKKSKSHIFLEKPAMYSELPNLSGKSVLCLGCGSGEECQTLKEKGAENVVGIDISKGLIEQAKFAYPDIKFEVMDMERLSFPENTFDFVYSSLVMHYVPDWRPTLKAVQKVLKSGGEFIFSTHHPIRFAAESSKNGEILKSELGFEWSDDDSYVKVIGDYLNPHQIKDLWFDKIKVTYYHKPVSDMVNEIIETGWLIEKMSEPRSTESVKKLHPRFYEINQKIPLFVIFKLKKG